MRKIDPPGILEFGHPDGPWIHATISGSVPSMREVEELALSPDTVWTALETDQISWPGKWGRWYGLIGRNAELDGELIFQYPESWKAEKALRDICFIEALEGHQLSAALVTVFASAVITIHLQGLTQSRIPAEFGRLMQKYDPFATGAKQTDPVHKKLLQHTFGRDHLPRFFSQSPVRRTLTLLRFAAGLWTWQAIRGLLAHRLKRHLERYAALASAWAALHKEFQASVGGRNLQVSSLATPVAWRQFFEVCGWDMDAKQLGRLLGQLEDEGVSIFVSPFRIEREKRRSDIDQVQYLESLRKALSLEAQKGKHVIPGSLCVWLPEEAPLFSLGITAIAIVKAVSDGLVAMLLSEKGKTLVFRWGQSKSTHSAVIGQGVRNLMDVTIAALYRDLRVLGAPKFIGGDVHPILGAHWRCLQWGGDSASQRAIAQIKSEGWYVRRLPQGHRRSPKADRRAWRQLGIKLPAGYTFAVIGDAGKRNKTLEVRQAASGLIRLHMATQRKKKSRITKQVFREGVT